MVRGLKTYIKNYVPNANERIKIENKIEEWKCANPGVTPIIVIDFAGFYRLLCNTEQGQLDVLFANHENSLDITKSVLRRFKNMGVKLEFFYSGSSKFVKNPELVSNPQHLSLNYINNALLHMLKPENSPEDILKHVNCPIYNYGSYFTAAIMLAEKYGRLHKSYYNACKRDLAMYATQHNAIAVITLDYEFVLVNSKFQRANGTKDHWKFWDLADFNQSTFEICQIDQAEVQNSLGLTDNELQIFGVLAGESFPGTLVPQFINKFGNGKYRFQNAAKYIKEQFSKAGLLIPVEIANLLSPHNIEKNVQIAEETLKFFANLNETEPVDDDTISIAAKRIHNSYAYEYLNKLHVPVSSLYWEEMSYPAFMDCALMIHRRQMGVVLQHTATEQSRWVICIDPVGTTNQLVQPVYPSFKVPPLLRLFNRTTNRALIDNKLKLACWIVSDGLNYKAIKNIPKFYLSAVLTLFYMVEKQFISCKQADCILYCIQEYSMNPLLLNSLPYPNSINKEPFQLAFLYGKFYQFITMSMNTVGLAELVVHNQLNGTYFHTHYEQFITFSSEKRDDLLNMVNNYRLYLNK